MSVPASARAIVSHDTFQAGGWKMEEVGLRQPGEGELLVEMVATGVCHTDALIGGIPAGAAPIAFYPRVLGHEGAGYVRAVGPGVTVANKDDPVLLSFAFCGKCPVCKSGGHSHCPSFNDMNFGPGKVFQSSAATKGSEPDIDGTFFGQSSFANWSIVKQCSVVNVNGIIKDKKDLQMFAPLGCGIQTGSGTVVNAAKAGPNDIICIIGLGGVGLSAIMGAKIQGCKTIIGIDRIESRMALAKEMGATHAIDTSKLGDKSLGDAVKEIADGVGPNITIDTTGVAFLMDAGWEFTRFKGRYFQVGSPPFDYTLKTTGFEMLLSGKQYQGVVEGAAYPPDYVPKMIQWYREGKFPIDKLLKLMPAADFNQAMHEMHSGETIKPILTW